MTPSGSLFADRFRIGALLGTGGTAAVYAATDAMTGDEVALKVLHTHLAATRAGRHAFLAEADRAAEVRHRNVLGVIACGEATISGQPRPWIATVLVHGRPLADYVAEEGPPPPTAVVALLRGIAAGLDAMHSVGLVHRDLTPANVLLDERRPQLDAATPLISDLGLADLSGLTVRTTRSDRPSVVGSADFMSPEQLRGDAVDARSDVYQLGAVGYFALTGTPPFPRGSVAEVLDAQLHAPPPPPSVRRGGVPRGLDRLIVRAMLKRPEDRHGSAAEFAAALDRLTSPRLRTSTPLLADADRGRTAVLGADAATRVFPAALPPDLDDGRAVAHSDAHFRLDSHVDPGVDPDGRPAPHRDYVAMALAFAILAVAGVGIAWALIGGGAAEEALPATDADPVPVVESAPPAPRPSAAPVAQVAVPDVGTLGGQDAVAALTAAGLITGAVSTIDAPRAAGTVLATSPVAGTAVPMGYPVDLVVASGRNPVPEVAGTEVEAAVGLVQRAGFSVIRRAVVPAPGTETLAQGLDPVAGTSLPIGSLVTVLVPIETAPPDEDTEDARARTTGVGSDIGGGR